MNQLATIGMYWEGEELSWIENLSILSFQRQGHRVELYSTNKNLTDLQGVEIIDPREVVEFPRNIERKAKPSFKADIFRLYLQKKTDRVWMDSDIVCICPVEFENGYLLPRDSGSINNAALRLPPDSEMLNSILEHIEDTSKVPFWLNPAQRRRLQESPPNLRLLRAGKLRRISYGPLALTGVAPTTGEDKFASAAEVYSPLPWWMTDALFCPRGGARLWITDKTQVVHLTASRIDGWHRNHMPLQGSFMKEMLDEVGYAPKGMRS